MKFQHSAAGAKGQTLCATLTQRQYLFTRITRAQLRMNGQLTARKLRRNISRATIYSNMPLLCVKQWGGVGQKCTHVVGQRELQGFFPIDRQLPPAQERERSVCQTGHGVYLPPEYQTLFFFLRSPSISRIGTLSGSFQWEFGGCRRPRHTHTHQLKFKLLPCRVLVSSYTDTLVGVYQCQLKTVFILSVYEKKLK